MWIVYDRSMTHYAFSGIKYRLYSTHLVVTRKNYTNKVKKKVFPKYHINVFFLFTTLNDTLNFDIRVKCYK